VAAQGQRLRSASWTWSKNERWPPEIDVANVPLYLIANLAIADGSGAPAPAASTPMPSRLRIDWIRVWKHA
jgi:beta-glucanase (GH16 family)